MGSRGAFGAYVFVMGILFLNAEAIESDTARGSFRGDILERSAGEKMLTVRKGVNLSDP